MHEPSGEIYISKVLTASLQCAGVMLSPLISTFCVKQLLAPML